MSAHSTNQGPISVLSVPGLAYEKEGISTSPIQVCYGNPSWEYGNFPESMDKKANTGSNQGG